jgi:hypothetical protein
MFANKDDYSKSPVNMIKETFDLRRRVEGSAAETGSKQPPKDHPNVIEGATLLSVVPSEKPTRAASRMPSRPLPKAQTED